MKSLRVPVLVAAMALTASTAFAVNTVVVTSKTVAPGETGVTIPILLTNDVTLASIIVPLVLREQTPGSFVTTLEMSYADRLPQYGPLGEITFRNQYADEDGTCKSGQPGGFGTITYIQSSGPYPVAASPEGMLFARQRLFGLTLPPGTDVSGSLILTVDVTGTPGTFEIDTTCISPAGHLGFVQEIAYILITPQFTKGVVTIDQNDPPVAVDNDFGARDGVTLYVVGAGVLTNDTDPEGDPLTAVLNTGVSHGDLDLHADGSFFYTPDDGFEGLDQFTYYADDGALQSLSPATVTLHVKLSAPARAGDFDENGELNTLDIGALISALFENGPDPTDGGCTNQPRGDLDCDGFSTGLDLGLLVDYLFAGGPSPCDPCVLQRISR